MEERDEGVFVCTYCGESFFIKNDLDMKVFQSHAECPKCGTGIIEFVQNDKS